MYPLSIFILWLPALRAAFGTPILRLPTSSGNITAYSNNAHIESHLSKRSLDSNKIVECPEGFTPRGGSRIVTCVAVHLKSER
ncbi:uncharacterized protein EAF01_012073 [Botrytis porri]|uniref:uncharacterized protein n=1 Tax=Botrytis porri TaxID=87229 RepID=UPI001900A6B7|nr:uncharacterized protein EAF01_012073 [Botrytis porri]KAF7880178.1 hypothetical protein EAF01_012073 [Botrytis porri]